MAAVRLLALFVSPAVARGGCRSGGCGGPFPDGTALPGDIGGLATEDYRCSRRDEGADDVEGPDDTRRWMEGRIRDACTDLGCSGGELATVLAIAMIENSTMDQSDVDGKGSDPTDPASNWCPYNLNADYLSMLDCDSSCVQGLGQYSDSFDIPSCTKYLLEGLRGNVDEIGDTCDFMHFHRFGRTGLNAGKGQGCGYEDSENCDGCSDYPKAIADAANQILANHKYAYDGYRVCEKVEHV